MEQENLEARMKNRDWFLGLVKFSQREQLGVEATREQVEKRMDHSWLWLRQNCLNKVSRRVG